MKTLISAVLMTLALPIAHAGTGYDGCYQLYMPNVMFPVVCLQGTTEEGINGAGVRLAIFGTNTDTLVYCAKSSGSAMTANSFTFEENGAKEIVLETLDTADNLKTGDATIGASKLKFLEIDEANASRLMALANASPFCEQGGGQLQKSSANTSEYEGLITLVNGTRGLRCAPGKKWINDRCCAPKKGGGYTCPPVHHHPWDGSAINI